MQLKELQKTRLISSILVNLMIHLKFLRIALLILFLMISALLIPNLYFRLDLTQDKRHTLSSLSKEIIKQDKTPTRVTVYLKGDFPAEFKHLEQEIQTRLSLFRSLNPNFSYRFVDPIKENLADSLIKAGVQPSVLDVFKDGGQASLQIFPWVQIKKDGRQITKPLFTMAQTQGDPIQSAIENLEYLFVQSISLLSQKHKQTIGIVVHHDELPPRYFSSFMRALQPYYNVRPYFPKEKNTLSFDDLKRLKTFDALVIAKPLRPFSEADKWILDQYTMSGGKSFWMLGGTQIEMDSLMQKERIAVLPNELNLTDFFFKYGIRINPVLVKDLQSAPLRIVTGMLGGSPVYQNFNWPYFPLIMDNGFGVHNITNKAAPVRLQFPSSIDIIQESEPNKTILLQSSPYTQIQTSLTPISLGILKTPEDKSLYQSGIKTFAVLIEGVFPSAYKNRTPPFPIEKPRNESLPTKMIVVADGNLAKNDTQNGQILPFGYDKWLNITYGNEAFVINSMDYLLDRLGIVTLKNKHYIKHHLNQEKVRFEKKMWQKINLGLPLSILISLMLVSQYYKSFSLMRKSKKQLKNTSVFSPEK